MRSEDKWACLLCSLLLLFLLSFIILTIDFNPHFGKKGDNYTEMYSWKTMRLPKNIHPELYELKIKLFLPDYGTHFEEEKNFTFEGEVQIIFSNKFSTKSIVLNQNGLILTSISVKSFGRNVNVTSIEENHELQLLTINLRQRVPPGQHILKLNYFGKMGPYDIPYANSSRETLIGLYKTIYKSANGTNLYAAITQFSPFDARRMVPCFDEPEYKASWKVIVLHPKRSKALGNGIEKSTQILDEWKETIFANTPRISSYLLAIFVGNFDYIQMTSRSGVRVRLYAPPGGTINSTATDSLKSAVTMLESFENLFNFSYPLKKLDMVEINYHRFNAMENLGLLTFNKNILTKDQDFHRLRILAHEIGHQWFGNLVTHKWWDIVWIKEGLATFFENFAIGKIDRGLEEEIFIKERCKALLDDSEVTSRSLSQRLDYMTDEIFDKLKYFKGSGIITMLQKIIGLKPFYKGIQNFLQQKAFKNVEVIDLFNALNAVVPDKVRGPDGRKFDVIQFGLQWTLQPGYPLLSLKPLNKTHGIISQKRFLSNNFSSNSTETWDVPIWLLRIKDSFYDFYWLPANGTLIIPYEENSTVVINPEAYAFVRVNYTETGWAEIFSNTIHSNRTWFQLSYDAAVLTNLNYTNFDIEANCGF